MTAPIARMTSDLMREMRDPTDAQKSFEAFMLSYFGCGPESLEMRRDETGKEAFAGGYCDRWTAGMWVGWKHRAALAAADAASQPPADERAAFDESLHWLNAALACPEFKWDGDQREMATMAHNAARASLAQPPAAPAVAGEVAMPEPLKLASLSCGIDGFTADQLRAYGDARASQALARVPGWQPIETAPDDMAAHLFRVNGIAVDGFKDATGQLCVRNERHEWRAMRGKPTHWMPLPAAPTEVGAA